MNKKLVFLVATICLLLFVAIFAYAQPNTIIRWEYTTTDHNLNELGREGWELVAVSYNTDNRKHLYCFKRRLP